MSGKRELIINHSKSQLQKDFRTTGGLLKHLCIRTEKVDREKANLARSPTPAGSRASSSPPAIPRNSRFYGNNSDMDSDYEPNTSRRKQTAKRGRGRPRIVAQPPRRNRNPERTGGAHPVAWPTASGDSEQEQFEVEAILADRFRDGETEYQVKWLNYPDSEISWEPRDNLANCREMLDAYEANKAAKSKKTNRVIPAGPTPKQSTKPRKQRVRRTELLLSNKQSRIDYDSDRSNPPAENEEQVRVNNAREDEDEELPLGLAPAHELVSQSGESDSGQSASVGGNPPKRTMGTIMQEIHRRDQELIRMGWRSASEVRPPEPRVSQSELRSQHNESSSGTQQQSISKQKRRSKTAVATREPPLHESASGEADSEPALNPNQTGHKKKVLPRAPAGLDKTASKKGSDDNKGRRNPRNTIVHGTREKSGSGRGMARMAEPQTQGEPPVEKLVTEAQKGSELTETSSGAARPTSSTAPTNQPTSPLPNHAQSSATKSRLSDADRRFLASANRRRIKLATVPNKNPHGQASERHRSAYSQQPEAGPSKQSRPNVSKNPRTSKEQLSDDDDDSLAVERSSVIAQAKTRIEKRSIRKPPGAGSYRKTNPTGEECSSDGDADDPTAGRSNNSDSDDDTNNKGAEGSGDGDADDRTAGRSNNSDSDDDTNNKGAEGSGDGDADDPTSGQSHPNAIQSNNLVGEWLAVHRIAYGRIHGIEDYNQLAKECGQQPHVDRLVFAVPDDRQYESHEEVEVCFVTEDMLELIEAGRLEMDYNRQRGAVRFSDCPVSPPSSNADSTARPTNPQSTPGSTKVNQVVSNRVSDHGGESRASGAQRKDSAPEGAGRSGTGAGDTAGGKARNSDPNPASGSPSNSGGDDGGGDGGGYRRSPLDSDDGDHDADNESNDDSSELGDIVKQRTRKQNRMPRKNNRTPRKDVTQPILIPRKGITQPERNLKQIAVPKKSVANPRGQVPGIANSGDDDDEPIARDDGDQNPNDGFDLNNPSDNGGDDHDPMEWDVAVSSQRRRRRLSSTSPIDQSNDSADDIRDGEQASTSQGRSGEPNNRPTTSRGLRTGDNVSHLRAGTSSGVSGRTRTDHTDRRSGRHGGDESDNIQEADKNASDSDSDQRPPGFAKLPVRRALKSVEPPRKRPRPSGGNDTREPGQKKRARPGVQALKEIRQYQRSTDLLIRKLPFQRLVRQIACEEKADIKMQPEAVLCLQYAAEDLVVEMFEAMQLLAVHRKRVTISPQDLKILKQVLRMFTPLSPFDVQAYSQKKRREYKSKKKQENKGKQQKKRGR